MGEEVKIIDVQAENSGTLIQVDFEVSTGNGHLKDRIFIPIRDIFKALNNYLHEEDDRKMTTQGHEKIDPEAPNPNLIQ